MFLSFNKRLCDVPVMALHAELTALIERSGHSVAFIAEHIGMTPPGLRRYTNPKLPNAFKGQYLKRELVEQLASALVGQGEPPIASEEVWRLAGMAPPTNLTENAQARVESRTSTTQMSKDLPVWGTAAGGREGAWVVEFGEAVDYVRRPPSLSGSRDAYAMYVVGDSMWPRYENGRLIFVHPRRPVNPGDFVVVFVGDNNGGGREAYCMQLVRRTDTKILLRQFNPEATIEIEKKRISAIHLILTENDLYGV